MACQWWQEHFKDHLLYDKKDTRAFTNDKKDKVKVFCIPCLDKCLVTLRAADEEELDLQNFYLFVQAMSLSSLVISSLPYYTETNILTF
jgi:hypothetical protein